MNRTLSSVLALGFGCAAAGFAALRAAAPPPPTPVVFYPAGAVGAEALAAREARRYIYLRTGCLLPLRAVERVQPGLGGAIVVGQKDRGLIRHLLGGGGTNSPLRSLRAEQFWLKTVTPGGHTVVVLTGGDDVGTLYAAYRFAEALGFRFYLHGDVAPDERVPLRLPILDERAAPLFDLRGIQPFHDFPEGPDWWNRDDYAAVIAQLPKLGMNFFGLHTYPENAPNAEPTVWIGLAGDAGDGGKVRASYPASYQNTLRGNWGYAAKKTSDFIGGAAALFEHDAYGPEPMLGHCPQPETPAACNAVFGQTAEMLRDAFSLARQLGVKTCVGTETPLVVPKQVAERLRAVGKDPADPRVVRELYEGIFSRVVKAYPLDYYWFWTPEGWTWEGVQEAQVQRTFADLSAAIAAAGSVGAPFRLATCGWVLGPQTDRALFDKLLPKQVAVSCINREVGRTPVDRGFADVRGRGKWAIPWLEDDPGLTAPQLWVGRMRRDAVDARRYGCDGLMGIHWRTRVLGPNVLALAQAAWRQADWNAEPLETPPPPPRKPGPVGGTAAAFPNNPIAGTADAPLYQTVRYNVLAYQLAVPNGRCIVTLKFCEPHYAAAGKRVFGVKLQGQAVLADLDIFAKVGQNRALDYVFPGIAVTNGWLDLEFVPVVEFPSIAALVVEAEGTTQKINCGGPAYKDYIADLPSSVPPAAPFAPTADFYSDWASHEFGPQVGAAAAGVFVKVDGHLPRPSDWVDGPGGIRPDARPWEEVSKDYGFVDDLAALRPRVAGAGNLARFDYWLETFRYLRGIARVNCAWGAFNQALQKAKAAASPLNRQIARDVALPLRQQLVKEVNDVYGRLLALVSNPGELGTVANWDQHLLPGLLTQPGQELAQLLGEDLPADAQPGKTYHGPLRVIVPTVRTSYRVGERLRLKVIILAETSLRRASLAWRRMGEGGVRSVPLQHVARGVFTVELPSEATTGDDLEYYVEAQAEAGGLAWFPATAPLLNQTVVALNAAPGQ